MGRHIVIPPGTPHTFWNAGEGELRFITDVRPAGQFQRYWEALFGLAAAGLPIPVTRALIRVLGGIGRMAGYTIP